MTMLRLIPAALGLGLATMWVIGMSVDATVWLVWFVGIAAALSFATVGLIPERAAAPVAAICLGLVAGGLFVLWLVALATAATPWLAWWTFVAGCLTALTAGGAAIQGLLDRLRTRPLI
jgi:hypothetical protein